METCETLIRQHESARLQGPSSLSEFVAYGGRGVVDENSVRYERVGVPHREVVDRWAVLRRQHADRRHRLPTDVPRRKRPKELESRGDPRKASQDESDLRLELIGDDRLLFSNHARQPLKDANGHATRGAIRPIDVFVRAFEADAEIGGERLRADRGRPQDRGYFASRSEERRVGKECRL